LFSKAKEGSTHSIIAWFRKKYNLSPKDPRFLEMTLEEIQEDFLIDRLIEDPNTTLENFTARGTSDSEWMLSIEKEELVNRLKQIFEGKQVRTFKKQELMPNAKDFEEIERETR
jgi:hypothetical protein